MAQSTVPRPFVKWAGGKRGLLPTMSAYFPKKFGTYMEPFLGGGAVLFYMLDRNPDQRCWVSDLNAELILTYVTIRDRVEELISALEDHSGGYFDDRAGYYYRTRGEEPTDDVARCARLIFLNKTCFNGLYRVNSKGRFNVPLGRYVNPSIVNGHNLRLVSRMLRSADISIGCGDFAAVLDEAGRDDFVYFDPPYQPVSQTSSFTSYTDRDFGLDDLKRLAGVCEELDSMGCKVVFSNSNTPEVRGVFGESWDVMEVRANRYINSNSKKRVGHTELLIKNF